MAGGTSVSGGLREQQWRQRTGPVRSGLRPSSALVQDLLLLALGRWYMGLSGWD